MLTAFVSPPRVQAAVPEAQGPPGLSPAAARPASLTVFSFTPTRKRLRLCYGHERRAVVGLTVEDYRGTVKTLLRRTDFLPARVCRTWNGTDDGGKFLPPGNYRYRLTAENSAGREERTGIVSVLKSPVVLGDYALPPPRTLHEEGREPIDNRALVESLKRLGANTYAYLIWKDSGNEWKNLPAFLDLARTAGIEVWVYMVPPTELPKTASGEIDYPPYQDNYPAWGTAVAELARSHPNLTALVMDDFAVNLKKFTPGYLREMRSQMTKSNPSLGFIPILYWRDLAGDNRQLVARYHSLFDGVIFPYANDPKKSLTTTASEARQIRETSAAARRYGLPIVVMIYGYRYPYLPPPTAAYIGRAVDIGLDASRRGITEGVVTFCLNKTGIDSRENPAGAFDLVAKAYRSFRP